MDFGLLTSKTLTSRDPKTSRNHGFYYVYVQIDGLDHGFYYVYVQNPRIPGVSTPGSIDPRGQTMDFTRIPRSLVGFVGDLLVIPRSGVVENTHFLITFGYHFWWVISDLCMVCGGLCNYDILLFGQSPNKGYLWSLLPQT